GRRQERDHHADDKTTRGWVGEHADGEPPQPNKIDRQQGEDRTELDKDREGIPELFARRDWAEELVDQEQVPGRRDRQELGQALDHAENDGLQEIKRHRGTPRRVRGTIRRPVARPRRAFPLTSTSWQRKSLKIAQSLRGVFRRRNQT